MQRQQYMAVSAEVQERLDATVMNRKQRIKTSQATSKSNGAAITTTKHNLSNNTHVIQTMDQIVDTEPEKPTHILQLQ